MISCQIGLVFIAKATSNNEAIQTHLYTFNSFNLEQCLTPNKHQTTSIV